MLNRLPHSEVRPFFQDLFKVYMQVLSTDNHAENGFKRGLFQLIDALLEMRVPVRTGRACFKTLIRPLASDLLAVIVRHVRRDLYLAQVLQFMDNPEHKLRNIIVESLNSLSHSKSICRSIVNLLVTCSDSVSIRKKLLVSLKHVLGTNFKRGSFPLIDILQEERVLAGTGLACFKTLRSLAYILLAEIVHHVCSDLSLAQLSRIIYLFSTNMHDASMSLSIHTTCARLMLNLVEPIFEKGVDKPSMDEVRILLGPILDAFVSTFSTFKSTIPQNGRPVMEDRIGQLPDDVLAIIICKLALKEAGRTCVLSRRWKKMWTFINRLNFDASEGILSINSHLKSFGSKTCQEKKYTTWVNQVMENHHGSNLDEFVIKFDFDKTFSHHVDKWITFALTKRVKALKIELCQRKYNFMRSAPSLPGVECLTSLHLRSLYITEETIQQLLSVCSQLEQLILRFVNGPLKLSGSLLKLKYLNIHHCESLESIEICAPNIVSFLHSGISSRRKLQLQKPCNLVDLCIAGNYVHTERHVYDALIQFSSYFSQLEKLCLYNFCYLNYHFHVLLGLPKFKNLRHLTIKLSRINKDNLGCLLEFINLCPSLHKFTVRMTIIGEDHLWNRAEWHDKLHTHKSLKVIEMVDFVDYDCSIKFVRCFLKRAIKLEKLIIDTCHTLSKHRIEMLEREKTSTVELFLL